MKFDPTISDEDERWLFERTARQLQTTHGHSEARAVALIDAYRRRFTDAEFCERFNLSVQTTAFFHREESLCMADRIQYFEHLGHEPDEAGFTRWQRGIRG